MRLRGGADVTMMRMKSLRESLLRGGRGGELETEGTKRGILDEPEASCGSRRFGSESFQSSAEQREGKLKE